MSGDGSLGYWSCETSHSSFQLSNSNGIFDDESLEVSAGDGRCGHRSLATSHSSSHNSRIYHSSDYGIGGSRYQENIHSFSCNCGVYHFGVGGRGGTRSQDTSHSSSGNIGSRVDVDARFGYRYQTSHSYSDNSGGHGILLCSSVSSCTVDKNVYDY